MAHGKAKAKLYTIKEAARKLKDTPNNLYVAADKGELHIHKEGPRLYVSDSDIEAYKKILKQPTARASAQRRGMQPVHVGDNLKLIRCGQNKAEVWYTQEEWAEKLGVHQSTVKNLENNLRRINYELLEKYRELSGWTADEIMFPKKRR